MEPEEPQESQPSQKPSRSYGKRPIWYWVLIYVIVAIVVYGVIYLVFIRKTGGTGVGGY